MTQYYWVDVFLHIGSRMSTLGPLLLLYHFIKCTQILPLHSFISIYESWFPKRTGRLSTIAKKIYYVRSCFYGVDFLFVHACLISDLLFHTVRLPWNFLCPFHRPAATSFSPAYLPRSSTHAGRLAWSSSLQRSMPAEQRPYPYRSSFHTMCG